MKKIMMTLTHTLGLKHRQAHRQSILCNNVTVGMAFGRYGDYKGAIVSRIQSLTVDWLTFVSTPGPVLPGHKSML